MAGSCNETVFNISVEEARVKFKLCFKALTIYNAKYFYLGDIKSPRSWELERSGGRNLYLASISGEILYLSREGLETTLI